MRILFLTPQSPYPPHKGTSTRNFNLIKNVATRHEVHLLTFVEPDAPGTQRIGEASAGLTPEAEAELRRFCATVRVVPVPPRRSVRQRLRSAVTTLMPDLALRLASPEMAAALPEMLRGSSFDLVQVEGLEMAPHWLAAASASGAAFPPVLLDSHNCEYVLQRRAFTNDLPQPRKWAGATYSLLQWRKLCRYEGRACRDAAGVLAVSENDRAALSAIAPHRPMAVVPNGIDTDYFRPSNLPRAPAEMVFTGTMDFRPNVDAVLWFCRQVFPLVRARVPEARFYVVGQRPKPEVQALAEQPGVVVTGAVEDVRPYLWSASLCVVPLRVGGGTRFKILEAMACGTPVVSTTLGAEGITLTPGEHALLADAPAELAGAIISGLGERERTAAMAERGRALATAHYEWRVLAGRLLSFYQEIVASGPSSRPFPGR